MIQHHARSGRPVKCLALHLLQILKGSFLLSKQTAHSDRCVVRDIVGVDSCNNATNTAQEPQKEPNPQTNVKKGQNATCLKTMCALFWFKQLHIHNTQYSVQKRTSLTHVLEDVFAVRGIRARKNKRCELCSCSVSPWISKLNGRWGTEGLQLVTTTAQSKPASECGKQATRVGLCWPRGLRGLGCVIF